MNILIYIIISLANVFLHIARSILVIKANKIVASLANCVCYTFSAVVIKFIAETELWIAIAVQATTNFVGCYLAMMFCEWYLKRWYFKKSSYDTRKTEQSQRTGRQHKRPGAYPRHTQ